jgi:hypothetical protein
MDFLAALRVGKTGSIAGLNMTDKQLEKAEHCAPKMALAMLVFIKVIFKTFPVHRTSRSSNFLPSDLKTV